MRFQVRGAAFRHSYGNYTMKLTIVIPALNEEDAIGSTIERCLTARSTIMAGSPVRDVEIIVVSDGSTDRTNEIASGYDEVRLIVFEKNQGYGAAIKRGFEEGTGDLVSFLDADGTCDPAFFATLCRLICDENASVAMGSRMGPDSRMPRVRRFGNRIYALILSALANRVVTDTASGMRVIRRDALPHLYPLPDGLHFTPAMSARVLMDDRLTIVECPMSYEDRVGESKLHVMRDGVRFLRTIFEMTLMWRPARLFMVGSLFCLAFMLLLAVHPIESYLRTGGLAEDTIYRLLFCSLLGAFGFTLLSAALLADQFRRLLGETRCPPSFSTVVMERVYSFGGLGVASLVTLPMLGWLVGPGIWTRLVDGYVSLHWSRVVLAGLIAFGWWQMAITVLTAHLLKFHTARRSLAASADLLKRASRSTSELGMHTQVRKTLVRRDDER